MKKEAWLLKEVEKWENEQLISEEAAALLKTRYTEKQNFNTMIIVFSIIGTLLIGTGIILIGAKNWYKLPIGLKFFISIAPLLVSQALAVYVVKKKQDSTAWRESAAILMTTTVFSSVAMVSQSFHISGDFGTYLLTCGLLSLPIIYILNACVPLLVYFYAITNWGALAGQSITNAGVLTLLFVFGLAYVFQKRKEESPKFTYLVYLSLVAGFVSCWTIAYQLEGSILLALLAYLALLFSIGSILPKIELPCNLIATVGGVIILMILTFQSMWKYAESIGTGAFYVMISSLILASIIAAFVGLKKDKLKFLCIFVVILICIARFVWQICELNLWPYDFIFMIFSNIALSCVSVALIVLGTKKKNLLIINWGLVSACLLIVLRFFDQDMDFFWRGIIFLVLGVMVLLFNLKVIKMKKREVSQ